MGGRTVGKRDQRLVPPLLPPFLSPTRSPWLRRVQVDALDAVGPMHEFFLWVGVGRKGEFLSDARVFLFRVPRPPALSPRASAQRVCGRQGVFPKRVRTLMSSLSGCGGRREGRREG